MKRLPFLLLILLAGCGARTVEKIVIQEVKIPVPIRCDRDVGPEPIYSDNDEALEAAPDILAAMRLRVAGRIERMQRERIKDAAQEGCRVTGPPPDPG